MFLALLLLMIGAGVSALFKNRTADQSAPAEDTNGEETIPGKSLTLSESELQPAAPSNSDAAPSVEQDSAAPTMVKEDVKQVVAADPGEVNLMLGLYPQAIGFEEHVSKLGQFISAQGIDEAVAKKRAALIVTQSRSIDLDPAILGSIIFVFSKFDDQTSQNGRHGLMFLSQTQAEAICKRELVVCESEAALLREDYNLFLGSLELSHLAKKYSGELPMLISAYLFGESSDVAASANSQEIKDLVALVSASVEQIRNMDATKKVESVEKNIPKDEIKVAPTSAADTKSNSDELNPKSFMMMSIDLSGRDVAEAERMLDLISSTAEKYKVDPLLVGAIAWNISGLNPNLQGAQGRLGLMQLDPAQGPYIAGLVEKDWLPAKLMEPDYNIELATSYFALLMDIFEGNQLGALTAYHWDVKQFTSTADAPEQVPPSSSNFARQVISTYDNWRKEYEIFATR